ncbi:MAG: hypothetical protein LUG52_03800 [Clostridia bacterium]|nr:hypothetical protein [Clostridia bacterium]
MSAKNLDNKGRHRSKIVAFRVSPEESELIDTKVRLSGLTKQDYIIRRLTDKEIVVVGNPRVYKALKDELNEVLIKLQSAADNNDNDELLETIQLIAATLGGMKEE